MQPTDLKAKGRFEQARNEERALPKLSSADVRLEYKFQHHKNLLVMDKVSTTTSDYTRNPHKIVDATLCDIHLDLGFTCPLLGSVCTALALIPSRGGQQRRGHTPNPCRSSAPWCCSIRRTWHGSGCGDLYTGRRPCCSLQTGSAAMPQSLSTCPRASIRQQGVPVRGLGGKGMKGASA